MKKSLLAISAMVFSVAIFCENLYGAVLIKDKKANAGIVISADATKSAQLAAKELQYHIEKVTGAKLPVTADPSSVSGVKIFVGESPETVKLELKNSDFKNQEYMVKVNGDVIVLMGKDKADSGKVDYNNAVTFPSIWDEIGTLYAVYDFLEKLGIRWYLPTELGTTFTPTDGLEIADVEVRRSPAIKYRDVSNRRYTSDLIADTIDTGKKNKPLSARDTILFLLRQRQGGNLIRINHSVGLYYKRFLESHPDWFAQGYEGTPPQPCYSNPEFLKQVVQDARDYFDGKVELWEVCSNVHKGVNSDVFPVVPMDTRAWCKCPKCQAKLKAKDERGVGQFSSDKASDYILGFVNEVAKEIKKTHPDKYIGTLAYMDYSYPPENVKLEPNVMIGLCLASRQIYSKSAQANIDNILKVWKKAYPNNPKMVWMWWCFPAVQAKSQQFRCFPGFFANHVGDYMKKYVDAGVNGIFIEPSYMDYPTVHGILLDQVESYINWKLADDPTLDADVLFNEFFDRYYGKAAGPMKKFYLLVEKIYCDPKNYPAGTVHQNEEIAWGRLGTEKRMKQLGEYMQEARKLADIEPFKQRVDLFDRGVWQYMKKGRQDYLDSEAMMAPTMQQTAAPKLVNKEPGNPLTLDWNNAGRISLRYGQKADIIKLKLSAKLAHDGEYFYIMYEQKEVDTDKLISDQSVSRNDEWESFFAKQRGFPYRQLLVDSAGKTLAVDYDGIAHQKWDFKGKIISQEDEKAKTWKTYIAIPLSDIVLNGIKPGEMLYFNVIRSCECKYLGSWIPTFGGYRVPKRFGEVYLEK